MATLTQVAPVSEMQRSYIQLFNRLDKGPVIITSKGSAAAVLLSVGEYDRQRNRLAQLERAALAAERSAEVASGNYITGEQFAEELKRLGIE